MAPKILAIASVALLIAFVRGEWVCHNLFSMTLQSCRFRSDFMRQWVLYIYKIMFLIGIINHSCSHVNKVNEKSPQADYLFKISVL